MTVPRASELFTCFRQSESLPRLLLKRTRRIGHVKPATAITDRQTIREHVFAKLDRHVGVERLHETVVENVAGDDVRMSGTENQLAVGMNARPVKRHEAALVAERVEIVGEVGLIIGAAQLAGRGDDKRRREASSSFATRA